MGGKLFDPRNRSSFSPVYNDFFYYQYIMYGEALDSSCSLTGNLAVDDADHDLLNRCEEAAMSSATPSGPNPFWTTAMGNHSDPFNFDSDGDGLMDSLALRFTRLRAGAMGYNGTQAVIGSDKVGTLLRQHRNLKSPSSSPAGLQNASCHV